MKRCCCFVVDAFEDVEGVVLVGVAVQGDDEPGGAAVFTDERGQALL